MNSFTILLICTQGFLIQNAFAQCAGPLAEATITPAGLQTASIAPVTFTTAGRTPAVTITKASLTPTAPLPQAALPPSAAIVPSTTFSQAVIPPSSAFTQTAFTQAAGLAQASFTPAQFSRDLGYPNYPATWPTPYGGAGEGNVAVAGELPVAGSTAVVGHVPITGAVTFVGAIPAAGAVSITGNCACGCNGPYLY